MIFFLPKNRVFGTDAVVTSLIERRMNITRHDTESVSQALEVVDALCKQSLQEPNRHIINILFDITFTFDWKLLFVHFESVSLCHSVPLIHNDDDDGAFADTP